ncbi:MAG: hypothetical protein ACRDPO_23055 [Streptosporangiaceae bacterium]
MFQIIISEAGQRTQEGQSQAQIADQLYPVLEMGSSARTRAMTVPNAWPEKATVLAIAERAAALLDVKAAEESATLRA